MARASAKKASRGSSEDATPQRLRMAGSDAAVGADGVRRLSDDPLSRLAARGLLWPGDEDRNRLLAEAGERFRTDRHRASLDGPGAMDVGRVGGGAGDPAWSMPLTERMAHWRWRYRQAVQALGGPYLAAVVEAVVCDERSLEDVGRQVSGRPDPKQAQAVAMDRLREGLRVLAVHYGLVRLDRADPVGA